MKYIVYKTTNKVNGKIYVGVHQTDDPDKFDGYIGCGISDTNLSIIKDSDIPFHRAVMKYGYQSFSREILFVYDNKEDALSKEKEIVNEAFVNRSDTYNITLGGGYPPRHDKAIFQYDINGNFIKQWDSNAEAERFYGKTNSGTIRTSINEARTAFGYLWSETYQERLDISNYHIVKQNKPVYMYDINYNYYSEFDSLSECARSLNVKMSTIQKAIKRCSLCQNSYYLSLIKSDKYINNKNILEGPLHQYDKYGNYINSYQSIKDAESQLHLELKRVNDYVILNHSYKSYYWRRGNDFDMHIEVLTKCNRKVAMYSLNNEYIKTFDSVREARKYFPNVSKVLRGSCKSTQGYIFKYTDL